jgi:AbrB family looped-hinge helix DNA binding protein
MQLETILSAKGQIVIPKAIRDANRWQAGMRMMIDATAHEMTIRPVQTSRQLPPETVGGCLAYTGTAKTIDEMHSAIQLGMQERMQGRKVWV